MNSVCSGFLNHFFLLHLKEIRIKLTHLISEVYTYIHIQCVYFQVSTEMHLEWKSGPDNKHQKHTLSNGMIINVSIRLV